MFLFLFLIPHPPYKKYLKIEIEKRKEDKRKEKKGKEKKIKEKKRR
jgi:hypothetical protein